MPRGGTFAGIFLFSGGTFVRTSELIGAKWVEFHIEANRWDIPADRMKMRIPHVVLLGKQTVELLGRLQEVTGDGELLF